MIEELRGVLARDHLASRLARQRRRVDQAVKFYARLCQTVEPLDVPRIVPNDPDDDHVVAAAVAARAHLIVSGDKHLLSLKDRIGIQVLKPGEALQFMASSN